MHFTYGTAGFRYDAAYMERLDFRVGIFMALKAKLNGLGGVMVTASHNPPHYNGLKLVERDGFLLGVDWEPLADEIVNAEDIGAKLEELD